MLVLYIWNNTISLNHPIKKSGFRFSINHDIYMIYIHLRAVDYMPVHIHFTTDQTTLHFIITLNIYRCIKHVWVHLLTLSVLSLRLSRQLPLTSFGYNAPAEGSCRRGPFFVVGTTNFFNRHAGTCWKGLVMKNLNLESF